MISLSRRFSSIRLPIAPVPPTHSPGSRRSFSIPSCHRRGRESICNLTSFPSLQLTRPGSCRFFSILQATVEVASRSANSHRSLLRPCATSSASQWLGFLTTFTLPFCRHGSCYGHSSARHRAPTMLATLASPMPSTSRKINSPCPGTHCDSPRRPRSLWELASHLSLLGSEPCYSHSDHLHHLLGQNDATCRRVEPRDTSCRHHRRFTLDQPDVLACPVSLFVLTRCFARV